jgi:hypothetical protein
VKIGTRRKGKGDKAEAQAAHARRRALERYGLELSREQYLELCRGIQDGVGTCLGRQSNRLSVWCLEIRRPGTFPDEKRDLLSCNVIYDKTRHTIVTFLPPGITDAQGVAL